MWLLPAAVFCGLCCLLLLWWPYFRLSLLPSGLLDLRRLRILVSCGWKVDKFKLIIIFSLENGTELYTPTAGIFNRCTMLFGRVHCANFNIDGLATDSNVFPGCWKASLFFLALGLSVMALTVFAAVIGCCVQSIGRKSIFNLAGVAQAIAGN